MVDNNLTTLPDPVILATNDMSAFPDTSICGIDKIGEPIPISVVETELNLYIRGQDKDGYLLYHHDRVADGKTTDLVDYVNTQFTVGTYIVSANGKVTQVATDY